MTYQLSQVIREATRRWIACSRDYGATCQKTDPEYPKTWCDACVARALLDVVVQHAEDPAPEPEPEPRRVHPRMVEAQRRRRAAERETAATATAAEQFAREAGR